MGSFRTHSGICDTKEPLHSTTLRPQPRAAHAAALPQPAGRSEQYSNSVDATLASGLEAKSYQPESNSYKESITLVVTETTRRF
ncbi:hypothetical protein BASA83_006682 [Batrachochytrium salamandrivorans]|nr:hypothetical protein BASA83_006682 [Batrachochytrium salamandrivorans]